MNSQVAFLQWVGENHPSILRAAVQKVQRKVSFGGLGDDLLSDVSFDPGSLSVSDNIAYDSSGPGAPSSTTDWSGIINSVASAIPQVAQSYVQTQAQLQTIQVNAQRAQQGLPPLGSTSLLTGQGLGTISTPMILLLGVGLFAVLAMGGRSSGGSSTPAAS